MEGSDRGAGTLHPPPQSSSRQGSPGGYASLIQEHNSENFPILSSRLVNRNQNPSVSLSSNRESQCEKKQKTKGHSLFFYREDRSYCANVLLQRRKTNQTSRKSISTSSNKIEPKEGSLQGVSRHEKHSFNSNDCFHSPLTACFSLLILWRNYLIRYIVMLKLSYFIIFYCKVIVSLVKKSYRHALRVTRVGRRKTRSVPEEELSKPLHRKRAYERKFSWRTILFLLFLTTGSANAQREYSLSFLFFISNW